MSVSLSLSLSLSLSMVFGGVRRRREERVQDTECAFVVLW